MEASLEKQDTLPFEGVSDADTSDRRSRAGWHVLACAMIIGASLLLFYLHFSRPGYLMHADMTWPLTFERIRYVLFHTWYPWGSAINTPNLQRLLWSVPFLLIAQIFRLSGENYLLLLFIGTFSIAGISMYALSYNLLSRVAPKGISTKVVIAGAAVAGLIYMYNPWSISHLWSFWMYPAYALMPIIFLVTMKVIDRPTLAWAIALGLLAAVASTHPTDVVWIWFVIVTYALFYLVANRFSRQNLARVGKAVGLTAGVYLLASAMWVWPYVSAIIAHKPMVATYSEPVSQAMLDGLAASNTIANNLRLISGWGYPVSPVPTGSLSVILSFALPLAALIGLVALRGKIRKSAAFNYWIVMFVLSVLLATGTTFLLRKPYSYAVLGAPGSSAYGWIFRDPARWLSLVPVFYGLFIGALLIWLLSYGIGALAGRRNANRTLERDVP